jgi:hypothetical protein
MSTNNPANAASSPVPPLVRTTADPPQVTEAPPESDASDMPSVIYLIAFPKIVFLYPTYLASFVLGFLMLAYGDTPNEKAHDWAHAASLLFLMLVSLNLVVLSFDFPRTTSLTLFFGFAAVTMGLVLLFTFHPKLVPVVSDILSKLKPWANAQFYFLFATLMTALYGMVWIATRFDYWEVRPNELLHHHGFLSDLERFSSPHLRISKEINDVFEYLLLRSGRLILHPTNEPRAFVLDNVLNINHKEAQLTRMLGTLQVQFRADTNLPRAGEASHV